MKLSELMQKRQNDIIEDATDSLLLAEIDDWIRQAAKLEARIKALEACVSKSVLRRLDAQVKESDI